MNSISIVGRLTKDPVFKEAKGKKGVDYCYFTVAVNRPFKNKDGEQEADFFFCKCFGNRAEFIDEYFSKGEGIALVGEMRLDIDEESDDYKQNASILVNQVSFPPSSKSKDDDDYDDDYDDEDEEDEEDYDDEDEYEEEEEEEERPKKKSKSSGRNKKGSSKSTKDSEKGKGKKKSGGRKTEKSKRRGR